MSLHSVTTVHRSGDGVLIAFSLQWISDLTGALIASVTEVVRRDANDVLVPRPPLTQWRTDIYRHGYTSSGYAIWHPQE